MMYTLDLIVISIGIIEFFQLVSILTSLVYSYILYVCMLSISRISISIGNENLVFQDFMFSRNFIWA